MRVYEKKLCILTVVVIFLSLILPTFVFENKVYASSMNQADVEKATEEVTALVTRNLSNQNNWSISARQTKYFT